MSMSRIFVALLVTPMLGATAWAQLPGAPAPVPPVASGFPAVSSPLTPASGLSAPISAPPSPTGIAAYPPPPGGPTLGSFLGLSYAQREYRQRRLARTPLGKLRSRIQEPLSNLTGGLIPPFPPKVPSLAELQAPGPVGASAKVKLDREAAGERIEAVRYLGKVDCHYWPEAGDALVDALRADRNEWVRLAAAETLGTGCCCTKKTIMALSMVVSCSIEDGNPVEKSPQVIAAAQAALARCLARASACETELYVAPTSSPILPGVTPEDMEPQADPKLGEELEPTMYQAAWSKPAPGGQAKSAAGLVQKATAHVQEKSYYERVEAQPWGSVLAAGKQAMLRQPIVPADARLAGYRNDLEQAGFVMSQQPQHSDRPANLLDMLLDDEPKPAAPIAVVYAQPRMMTQPMRMSAPPPRPATHEPQLAQRMPMPSQATKLFSAELPKPEPKAVTLTQQPAPKPVALTQQPTPKPVMQTEPEKLSGRQVEPRWSNWPETDSKVAPSRTDSHFDGTAHAIAVQTMLSKPGKPETIRQAVNDLSKTDLISTPTLPMMLLRVAEAPTDTDLRAACIRALSRCSSDDPGIITGLERLTNERDTIIRVEATLALQDREE